MIRTMIQRARRLLGAASPPAHPATRPCERCGRSQTFHITTVGRGGGLSEAHLCEGCARPVLTTPYPSAPRPAERPAEVRAEVERVVICETDDHQLLTFREVEGERRLSFVLGIFEATVIDRLLRGLASPRPLTHDAWLASLTALGAGVREVCIRDRRDDTFYAEVRLSHDGRLARVEVRPSDALALALSAGAPVLIADRLLAEASAPGGER
jgi:bifunctional DNase/RNase